MARFHRSYSLEFKCQVAQQYLSDEIILSRLALPATDGPFYRLCGWTQGTTGSHRDRVSAYPGSVVFRAPDPQQPQIRHLERSQAVGADLRAVYTALTVEAARAALGAFAEHSGEQYPAIAPGWERNWGA